MVSKKLSLFKAVLLVFLGLLFIPALSTQADAYQVTIIDDQGLISSDAEFESLKEAMFELGQYGNVLFYSCATTKSSSYSAEKKCYELFGESSAAVFCIDMWQRELTVYVNGEIGNKVSKGKCDTIADNVYKYASRGEYAECARVAFSQVLKTYKGSRIDSPMQTASNICLALIFALLINFFAVKLLHGNRKMDNLKMLKGAGNCVFFKNAHALMVSSSKRYSPRSKGGGGGRGGGFGGGHGGSHRF